jgi:RNA polymerase sigma-70 factor, ECF subfamily
LRCYGQPVCPPKENADLPESDWELARRANEGDEGAFHEIVERFSGDLYRLAFSLVRDPSEVEDVLQESLLAAFRRIGTFGGRSSLMTWLIGILIRQAAKQNRYRRIREALSIHSLKGSAKASFEEKTSVNPIADAELEMDVHKMLGTLSRKHREAIVLRELHGFSYKEIGEALGVPVGTVESRIFRARQELKERFGDYLE